MPTTRVEVAADLTPRRVPTQERSRRRVEAILDATAELVVGIGVEELTTREIAVAADVPVASIYQYFADKEAVLLALAARDMDEMDEQVASDLATLDDPSVADVVAAAMHSFVAVYHRRRAFVEIYLRGRTNLAVHQFGREHNARIATNLLAFAEGAGLAGPDLSEDRVALVVEVGDRVFQLAFESDPLGDQHVIEEGIVMITAYLERYAA